MRRMQQRRLPRRGRPTRGKRVKFLEDRENRVKPFEAKTGWMLIPGSGEEDQKEQTCVLIDSFAQTYKHENLNLFCILSQAGEQL